MGKGARGSLTIFIAKLYAVLLELYAVLLDTIAQLEPGGQMQFRRMLSR
jgi:hypothetical protein